MGKQGKKKRSPNQKRGSGQPAVKAPSKVDLELNDWDDETNDYLTVLRKRLRNMRKKMDKMSKLKEAGMASLNQDQKQSLKNLPIVEALCNELETVFRSLKAVAKRQQGPEPSSATGQKEAPAENEVQEDAQQAEADNKESSADIQKELTPTELLVGLSHASKICPSDIQQSRQLILELQHLGVDVTHERLRDLKTLNAVMTCVLCVDESPRCQSIWESAVEDAKQLVEGSDRAPKYTPNLTYAQAKRLIEAIQRTPLWTQPQPPNPRW